VTQPLKDTTAIVTGASRGLGKAIAVALAAAGAKVALLCKENCPAARETARRIEKEAGRAWAFPCDVADSEAVRRTIGEVSRRAGSIDVLVNNAGVSHSSLLLKTDERTWDEVISTNLTGAFNCTRAVIPFMLRRGKGHIVNISSLSGVRGAAGASAYCASKAGLIALTLATAREYGRHNIAANAVLPGYMPTDLGNSLSPASRQRILSENVLGRGSSIEEIAAFIARLIRMEGVSGQVFNLDSRPWR